MSSTESSTQTPPPPVDKVPLWLALAAAVSAIVALLAGMLARVDDASLAGAVLAAGAAFATALGLAVVVLQAARKL